MEPITVVVGGVCLTGALAATVTRKILHKLAHAGDTPKHPSVHPNVVSLHPIISYGFSNSSTPHPKDILLQAIREAERHLDIEIDTLTDLDIVVEMIRAHRRGVGIRIITDTIQCKNIECHRRMISELISEGILVKRNVQEDSLMHLKVVVVDGKAVTSGSFNFTLEAVNKNEEVLVRIDDVVMARDWQRHFDSMWNDRKRYVLQREALGVGSA